MTLAVLAATGALRAGSDAEPQAPALDGARVARAFPFHLWTDGQLRLRSAGSSLRKALPMLQSGDPLLSLFEVLRPRRGDSLEHWRAHGHSLVTLRTRGPVAMTLRGSAEVLDDGSLLLLVSPVLTSLEEIRSLGLGLNDFARHDAAGDLLMMARTTQMSAQDSQRLAERLAERTRQLDSILELSRNGVVAFDADGVLRHVNGALLQLLGLPRARLLGAGYEDFVAHLDTLLERPMRARERLDRAEGESPVLLHLVAPRPAVVQITSCRGGDRGRIFYWRDVTAETEVDRMKSEFLSTAAHELRTPMVSIFGFAELMLHRRLSDERRHDVVQTIHRQSALLIRMVNELLDLARIEARQGKDLQREPLRADRLVEDSVAGIQGALDGHRIAVDLPHGRTPLLLDPGKSQQALANVLSNAIKYSAPGSTVHVDSRVGHLDGHPALGLRVRDEGIGMTPEQVARVFERFYRADPSGNIPGTGLGMCLVKEIVELQGGRVALESRAGQGTQVTLWFPVAEATPLRHREDTRLDDGDPA